MSGTAQRRAIIIGAGIGGLTSGLALAGEGWDVEVLERARALKPVGYALVIAPNAQRALDAIPGGIVPQIHALAAIQGESGLRNAKGAWLSRNDGAIALERYGHPAVAMRRAELVEMLSSHLPAGALRLGTVAAAVNAEAGEVTLATGEVLSGDLVVAADGVHSGTRAALFPGHPQPAFAGLTAWQALIRADGLGSQVGATWSSGGEFGMLPLADGWLYVFAEAAVDAPMTPGRRAGDEKAELERRFGQLQPPIPGVIARIDSSSIPPHRHPLDARAAAGLPHRQGRNPRRRGSCDGTEPWPGRVPGDRGCGYAGLLRWRRGHCRRWPCRVHSRAAPAHVTYRAPVGADRAARDGPKPPHACAPERPGSARSDCWAPQRHSGRPTS